MNNQRLNYLDLARSFGIIAVVWGHHMQNPIFHFIYSFHIPLFFFVSGAVFNIRHDDIKTFAMKKAKRLLFPYLIFAFILFLKWMILGIIQNDIESTTSILKNFIGIFYAQGGKEYMCWGIPMWFLPCLFLVNVVYWVLNKFASRKLIPLTVVLMVFYFIFMSMLKYKLEIPWSSDVAVIGIFYFHLGVLFNLLIDSKEQPSISKILILASGLVITLFFAYNNERLDLYYHNSGNIFFHFISSISGILFIVYTAKMLENIKFPNYINKYSIPILAFHSTVGGYLLLSIKIITGYSNNNSILSLFYSLAQIAFIILGCALYHRSIPSIARKQKMAA